MESISVFKVRLMAKDYIQVHGIDNDETFSIVTMLKFIRILIVIHIMIMRYDRWMSKLFSSMGS